MFEHRLKNDDCKTPIIGIQRAGDRRMIAANKWMRGFNSTTLLSMPFVPLFDLISNSSEMITLIDCLSVALVSNSFTLSCTCVCHQSDRMEQKRLNCEKLGISEIPDRVPPAGRQTRQKDADSVSPTLSLTPKLATRQPRRKGARKISPTLSVTPRVTSAGKSRTLSEFGRKFLVSERKSVIVFFY